VLRARRGLSVAAGLVLVLGVAWPLSYAPRVLARDNSYQRHVVRLAGSLLGEDDTYLAGNDLVYNRRQSHLALRRLSAPHVRAMGDWPQARIDGLIAELEAARPKLIIRDYRISGLPTSLKNYLAARFDPLWSSVQSYAPVVAATEREFDIWFDGDYRVESAGAATIDDRNVAPDTVVALGRGRHRNASAASMRLRWLPPGFAAFADPAMKRPRLLFNGVYDY
jgi:hypothetical protein